MLIFVKRMISRICICCGEPFSHEANEAIGNPNICAACSQLTDNTDGALEFELTKAASDGDSDYGHSSEMQNAS